MVHPQRTRARSQNRRNARVTGRGLTGSAVDDNNAFDIAGTVASLTEGELGEQR
jgi:hypothetical protein